MKTRRIIGGAALLVVALIAAPALAHSSGGSGWGGSMIGGGFGWGGHAMGDGYHMVPDNSMDPVRMRSEGTSLEYDLTAPQGADADNRSTVPRFPMWPDMRQIIPGWTPPGSE